MRWPYHRALSEGISIAPGPLFSAREKFRNFVRLNFAQGWDERTLGAVARGWVDSSVD